VWVIRYRDRDQEQVVKVDYYLSNAAPETALEEFARVAKAEHRIEECLQPAGEAGCPIIGAQLTGCTIIKRSHTGRVVPWAGTHREKKWTPAMTLPQIRQASRSASRGVFSVGDVAY